MFKIRAILCGIAVLILLAVAIGGGMGILPLSVKTAEDPILIGTAIDSAGLVLHTGFNRSASYDVLETDPFDLYPVMDCCASTSQWALAGNSVDIMAMCPDSAADFIQKNDQFITLGPLVYNADVLVTGAGDEPIKVIGYAQGKERQKQMLEKSFDSQVTMQPMLFYALAYALEKGKIDGAVVDVLTAVQLNYPIYPLIDDEPSYVLVAHKDFVNTVKYKDFIQQYNDAVDALDNPRSLQDSLEKFLDKKEVGGEVEKWGQIPVRYGRIEEY